MSIIPIGKKGNASHSGEARIGKKLILSLTTKSQSTNKHLSGLKALKEEKIIKSFYVVSEDPIHRIEDKNINVIYWEIFISDLWAGKIF